MNGRTSSTYGGTSDNMFAGVRELNGFLAGRDQPCQILIGASDIGACGGSGECKHRKGLDREGPFEDAGFGREEKDVLVERIDELEKEELLALLKLCKAERAFPSF